MRVVVENVPAEFIQYPHHRKTYFYFFSFFERLNTFQSSAPIYFGKFANERRGPRSYSS